LVVFADEDLSQSGAPTARQKHERKSDGEDVWHLGERIRERGNLSQRRNERREGGEKNNGRGKTISPLRSSFSKRPQQAMSYRRPSAPRLVQLIHMRAANARCSNLTRVPYLNSMMRTLRNHTLSAGR